MTDGPNRRQPKSFEPPPWEKHQFDELARRRDEEQQEAELNQALADLARQKAEEAREQAPDEPGEPVASVPDESSADESGSGAVDEKVMEAMLTQLRMEEPKAESSLWKVSVVLSFVSALIGAILIVWGGAALLQKSGEATGLIGGSIVVLFGALFVGIGVWMAVRSLKERGVL